MVMAVSPNNETLPLFVIHSGITHKNLIQTSQRLLGKLDNYPLPLIVDNTIAS